jgi:uncharacterized membrane protein
VEGSRTKLPFLWAGVIFLALVGIASVVHRAWFLRELLTTGHRPSADPIVAGFAQHPFLTLVHIVPGALFMLLGPLQFVNGIRQRRPALHRWMGRTFLVCSVVIGISALVMGLIMPIGGANESAAIAVFGSLFLFALWRAYRHIRRREFARHREWMIRGFAIGLAVATIRPIVGIFFATSRLTHLTPHEFFGTAFWLGFSLQTMAAEVYIRTHATTLDGRP